MAEAFSYEDIYELLHKEKYSAELEPLSASDIKKIREYLKSKRDLMAGEQESTNIFSSQKRAKIQLELDNALRALKDLFDKRERKIISRAIFSTRTDSALKDTTNMLESEEKLYVTLLEFLPQNRKEFFALLSGEESQLEASVPEPEPEVEEPTVEPQPEPEPEIPAPTPEVPTVEPTPEPEPRPELETDLIKVKFLESIPEFIGPDLQKYGPYSPDDVSEIPDEIVKLLIHQGKAEKIGEKNREVPETKRNEVSQASEIGEDDEVPETNSSVLPEVQETSDAQTETSEDQTQT